MRQEITINLPSSWKDITLRKYLELQRDLEIHKDDAIAQFHFTIHHLCNLDASVIMSMTNESHEKIKTSLDALMLNQEVPLQRLITIDGIEYGFEPNLSKISYGAYLDITKNDTLAIDNNWAKIMSILYRPVIRKSKERYEIASYQGEVDDELFLDVGMDVVFGCWFFFINLQMDLLNYTLKFTNLTGLPANTKSILVASGKAIRQFLNSQMETYKRLTK
jgi:hypothetical protein